MFGHVVIIPSVSLTFTYRVRMLDLPRSAWTKQEGGTMTLCHSHPV